MSVNPIKNIGVYFNRRTWLFSMRNQSTFFRVLKIDLFSTPAESCETPAIVRTTFFDFRFSFYFGTWCRPAVVRTQMASWVSARGFKNRVKHVRRTFFRVNSGNGVFTGTCVKSRLYSWVTGPAREVLTSHRAWRRLEGKKNVQYLRGRIE